MKPSLSVQTDSIAAEHVQQRRSPYHDDQHQSYGHPQQYHHHPAPNAYGTGYETAYPIGYSPRHQTDTLHPPQGGRPHRPNSYAQGYGYDLNVSPRHSLDVPSPRLGDSKTPDRGLPSSSTSKVNETHEVEEVHERIPSPSSGGSPKSSSGPGAEEEEAQRPRITPSIRLLFSLLTPRHRVLLLLPAILSSIISGGIAPFMTYVVGQAFDAFANFPLSSSSVSSSSIPPDELKAAKDELLKQVGIAALSLLGLALGSLAMGSLTSFLWIWVGEVNAAEVRKRVYLGIMEKSMGWFDSRMGDSDVPAQGKKTKEGEEENGEMDGPVGAGGLMAKFTRCTDDVRQASSLASGLLIQHLTTSLTCLVLAFVQSWALTLVILATVPVLVVIQGFSQGMASPLLGAERHGMAISATLLERTLTSITTVKAFNAQSLSLSTSSNIFHNLLGIGRRLAGVWGVTSAVSQFVMMGMFVQGFWFGSKLVREGKIGAGEVMAVFWACLIATSNLQACIPQMILLGKGKEAAGSLKDFLALPPPSKPASAIPAHMALHSQSKKLFERQRTTSTSKKLRKIVPTKCYGEMALHGVTFSYPTRVDVEVLKDVEMYLPSGELTFVVGSSGSGKSSVASLLLGLYKICESPQNKGHISLDEQDIAYLDPDWVRSKVMGITQSSCVVLEGKTVAENVSCVVRNRTPTREEIEEACRAALLHDFILDLPNGYDTILGGSAPPPGLDDDAYRGGITLSGGQKQRLSFARARLRNPEVLILDEATSALDPTSRLLVFSAMKNWRRNKTTIVITHDLSQIEQQDFVYVIRSGRVVERGYRVDLEAQLETGGDGRGEFRKMLDSQLLTGGYLPEKDLDSPIGDADDEEEEEQVIELELDDREKSNKHQSLIRPITLGNWMFDVVAELLSPIKERRHSAQTLAPLSPVSGVSPLRINTTLANQTVVKEEEEGGTSPVSPTGVNDRKVRGRLSLQFVPATPSYGGWKEDEDGDFQERYQKRFTQESFEVEKEAVKKSGGVAKSGRSERGTTRGRPSQGGVQEMADVKQMRRQHPSGQDAEAQHEGEEEAPPAFWALLRRVYPTLPNKPLLIFGLVVCVLSGAMTPVFSFLLSRLLFEVSIGARNVNIINIFGGVVLSVAALDGFLLGLKYFIMELCGIAWVTELRRIAFERVLKQDTKWFDDKDRHSPARIVQIIVKDAEDARNLVAVVMGQCLVVSAMLGVGLVWAMVRGWELTLVGLGVAPVFGIVMSVQTRLVAKCEVRNKRAREALARSYYESILNIRAIRSLSLNRLFWDQFEQHSERALKTGVKGAFVEGCTYGIASGLIYLAEALLFYVGAVLIAKERYSYLQMVETLNLVVFSVTIGSQLMAFTEKIAKSAQATSDLYTLVELATNTSESHGSRRDPLCGPITLRNVSFAYPSRPTARVLNDLSLTIRQGECVAIVGHSGCGKSTLATLLQRLYEADVGEVRIGTEDGRSVNVRDVDVQWLRDHVAVVSQHPHLFDASVADNIRYGTSYSPSQPSTNLQGPPDYETATITHDDIIAATKAASVHDFIMSLPQGYDTVIGENAVLISGGQAQRIQIARALVRPRTRILILDECTSALDPENQAVVMESIRGLVRGDDGVVGKEKKTIVMVTHKVQVMQMCDRIVVLGDGEVKEEGTFDELVRRKGAFAALASGGEWNGD
ncbi:P-loop containing nucleoside triphosphate hydrolase protein [Coprinopsis sp. MPI-PUGE-AT-0042]|nr:P-loop containing nucleoside triphosphate hydrolase protein [Coprinopsis sp. MPI-PUGE-AT-0042]